MRPSEYEAIRPRIKRAIGDIDADFTKRRQSLEIAKELEGEINRRAAVPEGTPSKTKLKTLPRKQYKQVVRSMLGPPPKQKGAMQQYRIREKLLMRHPRITRPLIEHGNHWRYSAARAARDLYDSEKDFVNDSKGAAYVAQLLERRGKTIPCHVLHESAERSLAKNDPTISKDDAVAELAVLRDELAELRQRVEEKPHEVLPEDREEEQQILDRIRQLTGLGGRPRQKGAADASRTAVLNAVKRFYRACREKKLDAFVDHLESKLDMGSNPVYSGSVEWNISRVTPNVTM